MVSSVDLVVVCLVERHFAIATELLGLSGHEVATSSAILNTLNLSFFFGWKMIHAN